MRYGRLISKVETCGLGRILWPRRWLHLSSASDLTPAAMYYVTTAAVAAADIAARGI